MIEPHCEECGAGGPLALHCRKCLEELPGDQSPQEYARLEVIMYEHGLQISCVRHQLSVMFIPIEDEP